ncbi:MAG: MFS transporter [Lentisphaeria bacterium]|nr:MFS transporter [Lentisphaeria bacterium]
MSDFKFNLKVETFHTIFFSIGTMFFITSIPQLMVLKVFNGPDWLAVLARSSIIACNLLVVVFAGYFNQVNRRRLFLAFGLIVASLSFFTGGILSSTNEVILYAYVGITLIANLCIQLMENARMSLWRALYPGDRLGKVAALFAFVGTILITLSYTATKLIENGRITPREAYFGSAAFILLSLFVYSFVRVPEEIKDYESKAQRNPFKSLWGGFSLLWQDKEYGLYQLLQMILGAANLLILINRPVILDYEFGNITISQHAMIDLVVPTVATLISVYFWGGLVDKIGPVAARILSASCFSFTWVALYIGILYQSMLLVYVSSFCSGIAMGSGKILWRIAHAYFSKPERDSQYFAIHQALTGVRGLIFGFVGLFTYKFLGPHITLISLLLTLITVPGYVYLNKYMKKSNRKTTI